MLDGTGSVESRDLTVYKTGLIEENISRCNISRTFGFYNSLINKSEEATQWN